MKKIAIACIAALALSSCTTTGASKVDLAIQKNLPKACDALNVSYIAFSAVAAAGSLKPATIDKVNAAFAGVQIVCDDPAKATVATALIKVLQASIVVTAALKEAKAAENG